MVHSNQACRLCTAQAKKVEPYVLHATYVYGQQAGKKARLRDNLLWFADPPDYFARPKFVSMDIVPPSVTPHS